MYPKELNPYNAYLQEEVRRARNARDHALARYILDAAGRIMGGARSLAGALFRLEMRRDDSWVESMETKLRQHQPY